jgi:glycosyltransferase involved in cell wall biosynthesis
VKKMKVLMLGWEYPPFSSGGLGTHCYNITKALSSRGARVTFVMPGNCGDAKSDAVRIIRAGTGKVVRVGMALRPYLPSLPISVNKPEVGGKGNVYGRGFFSDVQKYTEMAYQAAREIDCDVIHCHDWMTFPAGIRIKQAKGKPLVVTVHSTEFDRTGSLCPNPWISDIEWQGMYHADRIIAVSNYEKRQVMEKYSVPGGKVEVVHNSINPGDYRASQLRFGLNKKVVLFLGRLTLQKGPDYFLKAAKRVLEREKNVKFVVVGTGDMLPQLIDSSINMGISKDVMFTGFQDSIEDYYRLADLYVMPSVSEPFGITALEAMASGTPVIISNQSGVREVVNHRFSVDFWDVDRMADRILGVLSYDCLRKEISSNGHREVSGMSWADAAEKTMGIYSKTIN